MKENPKFTVTLNIQGDDLHLVTEDYMGNVIHEMVATKDRMIQQALIKLGWIPPLSANDTDDVSKGEASHALDRLQSAAFTLMKDGYNPMDFRIIRQALQQQPEVVDLEYLDNAKLFNRRECFADSEQGLNAHLAFDALLEELNTTKEKNDAKN